MKLKSLALGAAAIAAATGAQAADLGAPIVEPVDYVRICDAYGAGFFFIPGTDTCLRISGRIRFDVRAGLYETGNAGTFTGSVGLQDPSSNRTWTRTRAVLYWDARKNTDFGLLRTFAELEFNAASGNNETFAVAKAFIQWGGLTAGHAQSFFDFYTGTFVPIIGAVGTSDTTTNLLAYTFAFGNGISATLSLEDGTFRRTGPQAGNAAFFIPAPNAQRNNIVYGGHFWPDVVANINVTQSWGSAQIMGAIHEVNGGRVGGVGPGFGPAAAPPGTITLPKLPRNSRVGWAVGGGVEINLATFLMGGSFSIQGAYADGATDYVTDGPKAFGDFEARNTIVAQLPPGTRLATRTTRAWGVNAGLSLDVAPQWSVGLSGGWSREDAANNWSADTYLIEGGIVWTPESFGAGNLLFAVVAQYADQNYNRAANNAGFQDAREAVGLFRIQATY